MGSLRWNSDPFPRAPLPSEGPVSQSPIPKVKHMRHASTSHNAAVTTDLMDRWEGIERPYTQEQVERLRGSVMVAERSTC